MKDSAIQRASQMIDKLIMRQYINGKKKKGKKIIKCKNKMDGTCKDLHRSHQHIVIFIYASGKCPVGNLKLGFR